MRLTVLFLAVARIASAQEPEATLSKDAISVHRVERGRMPLQEAVNGSIVSLAPARARVQLSPTQLKVVQAGQACSVQIVAPAVVSGTVRRVLAGGKGGSLAEIDLTAALPEGTRIGDRLDAHIDVGAATDIIFFARPADAQPNTSTSIFVLENDGEHARRVSVAYGRLSGALLEILSGLAPGDRVIVTDMSAYAGRDRVRLQ